MTSPTEKNSKGKRTPRETAIANQHQRTRRDHASETAEDYVEAISLIQRERSACRITDLAKHFMVSHVTVSRILDRLEREGLVETVPYAPVNLTEAGERLAATSRARHETVVAFLLALGVSSATAEVDAEGIEHHVSHETLLRMKQYTRDNQ